MWTRLKWKNSFKLIAFVLHISQNLNKRQILVNKSHKKSLPFSPPPSWTSKNFSLYLIVSGLLLPGSKLSKNTDWLVYKSVLPNQCDLGLYQQIQFQMKGCHISSLQCLLGPVLGSTLQRWDREQWERERPGHQKPRASVEQFLLVYLRKWKLRGEEAIFGSCL